MPVMDPPPGATLAMAAEKRASTSLQDISPVLFFTDEGLPMQFYVRPGPTKQKLGPLITAGGGLLSKTQLPSAILLLDPQEQGSIPKTSANWYVSVQYIYDCVDREAQLDIEDYRLNPEGKEASKCCGPSAPGRVRYTPEEDAAILKFLRQYQGVKTRGNRIWQQMEEQRLTSHPWQSMKDRYIRHISKQEGPSAEVHHSAEEEARVEEEEEEEGEETAKDAGGADGRDAPAPSSQEEEEEEEGESHAMQLDSHSGDDTATPSTLLTPEGAREPPERGVQESLPSPSSPAAASQPESVSEPASCSFTPTKSVARPVRKSLRRRLSMEAPPPGAYCKKLRSSSSDREPAAEPSPETERSPAAESQDEEQGRSAEAAAGGPEAEEQQRQLGILALAAEEFGHETEPPEEESQTRAEPAPAAAMEPVVASSEAHLFIFDSETQAEPPAADSPPPSPQAEGFALSQVQLDQDMLRITELMEQAHQDLPSVTKALLQTSGDFSEALALLTGSAHLPHPAWSRGDDHLLRAADPEARSQLRRRYGEQRVAKRMLFLELEG
ncbi:telomeric repeat-binding factor 2-interacting protein 1 isoform X2 [Synchiropus splendidus]|uniref:telomeric repeat-binding factor 2-interacting protein 1 isoform X2 n=1 Tax=Synchiropus splendidus TaxID=270530 RepID=UPI00237DBBE9|nr:telomeric repeat-binding factor 2-interacting protein 1 isoform X2 [Synchiropus splendidus]